MKTAAKFFEIGQWVETFEGIGQVIHVRANFVEKYTLEYFDGAKVGTYSYDILVCKLLCDFDGKIRKRNRMVAIKDEYCRPADRDSRATVASIRNGSPEEYRAFVVSDERAEIGGSVHVCFKVPDSEIARLHTEVGAINEALKRSFTMSEFLTMAKDRNLPLDFSAAKPFEAGTSNFDLAFFNRLYRTVGKQRIYTKVSSISGVLPQPKDDLDSSPLV